MLPAETRSLLDWLGNSASSLGTHIKATFDRTELDPKDVDGMSPGPQKHVTTIYQADEEFRIAASHVNATRGVAMAQCLIELRNNDHRAWEQLEYEVQFQFSQIQTNFRQWKANRIACGDRYK